MAVGEITSYLLLTHCIYLACTACEITHQSRRMLATSSHAEFSLNDNPVL